MRPTAFGTLRRMAQAVARVAQHDAQLLREQNAPENSVQHEPLQTACALLATLLGYNLQETPLASSLLDAQKRNTAPLYLHALEAFHPKKTCADVEAQGAKVPLLAFYEELLAAYNPSLRKNSGVYFTPAPVVSYVVRCVQTLLKDTLDWPLGFADPRAEGAIALDITAGAGGFLAEIAKQTTPTSPLRIEGIELLPSAAALAALLLKGTRAKIHCENALRAPALVQDARTVIVVGNPPYAGRSLTDDAFLAELLRGKEQHSKRTVSNYFTDEEGKPLREKNLKWLNDDYVKFLRLAHWMVERAPEGIVALVSNHGFLEHPTFRAVRASLLRDFSSVHVLDLHGNMRRLPIALTGPERLLDRPIFEAQAGTCVLLLARTQRKVAVHVGHAALRGTREDKLAWLSSHGFHDTPWSNPKPEAPGFFLVPRDRTRSEGYDQGIPLRDAMPHSSPCIVTGRDRFLIDEDRSALAARIAKFLDPSLTDAQIREEFLSPNDRLDLFKARAAVRSAPGTFRKVLYRPFDERWFYDHPALVERPRRTALAWFSPALLSTAPNRCLLTRRQSPPEEPWSYVFSSLDPAIDGVIRCDNHGSESMFPLYVDGAPNFAPSFVQALQQHADTTLSPEMIFSYVYGVLHDPHYREAYAVQLREDFPKIPLPSSHKELSQHIDRGTTLFRLHTDTSTRPSVQVQFHVKEGAVLRSIRREGNTVWINEQEHIDGVLSEWWTARIGSYAPALRWLQDRRGRTFDTAAQQRYRALLQGLQGTISQR